MRLRDRAGHLLYLLMRQASRRMIERCATLYALLGSYGSNDEAMLMLLLLPGTGTGLFRMVLLSVPWLGFGRRVQSWPGHV